ncbi:hypothetical protein MRX96_058220 [Rhipicephalus microplus]
MGLQELMLKVRKELRYVDKVGNDEDLIVQKLEQASPSKRFLPEDIGSSGDAKRLSISQQAFVARRSFLRNLRYSAALLTGSKEFLSFKAFFGTAKYVLKNARTVVLVPNKKSIFKLHPSEDMWSDETCPLLLPFGNIGPTALHPSTVVLKP